MSAEEAPAAAGDSAAAVPLGGDGPVSGEPADAPPNDSAGPAGVAGAAVAAAEAEPTVDHGAPDAGPTQALATLPGFEPPVPLTPPEPAEVFAPEPAWGSARTTTCLVCGETVLEGARFCERCGAPLYASLAATPDPLPPAAPQPTAPLGPPCAACGGRIAADGYCEMCGERGVGERDHWRESPSSWVGAVCDRGVRHPRNEDAMAVHAATDPGSFALLVVCDGVSTASHSDVASAAAAGAALDALRERDPHGDAPITGTVTERVAAWSAQMDVAAVRANEAISRATPDDGDRASPPSCTFVAAVVDGPLVVTGWIGDSRAYWVPDDGRPAQLSVDDSWAQELISQGMPQAAAESAPQAHAITRWLGPDAPDVDAHTDATFPDRDGWIVVCSDGLWNYCSLPEDLAGVLHGVQATVGTDPTDVAGGLVDWANAQGGRDNITVALARITPSRADAGPIGPALPLTELPIDPKESHG